MNTNQIKGGLKEAAGETQEHIGRALGDKETEAKGHAREAEGKAQKAVGNVQNKVDNVVDDLKK